ncbi:MAG: hypothetical protein HN348_14565, partial [Proteobacteria bacterium]|nr:hypothetical protein [Pseudomonadota bacterium]
TLSFALKTPGHDQVLPSAATGQIANLTNMGGGRYSARYVVPKVNYPHLSIITAIDPNTPHSHAATCIRLMGAVNYPVQTTPNSSVILRIGDREYGPVQASASGKAAVPIVVPPGTGTATLISVVEGKATEEHIDLRVPETKRLQLLPIPKTMPANPRLKIPVHVAVFTPTGEPAGDASLMLTPTAGNVGEVTYLGNGIYRADFTPPESNMALEATITAQLKGSSIQSDDAEIKLIPQPPAFLTLTAAPTFIPQGNKTFKIFAKALDFNGDGVADRDLILNAAGAKLTALQDMRGGDYRADFTITGTGLIEVHGMVVSSPSENPLRYVLLVPSEQRINNDGKTHSVVNVLTTDAFGAPVPNVAVKLKSSGDGEFPEAVTTDANGVAQAAYVAGQKATLVRIEATAGEARGSTAILQASNTADIKLPLSGTKELLLIGSGLHEIMPYVNITQEGGSNVVSRIPGTGGAGEVTMLDIKVSPETGRPGGTVNVTVKATDSEGKGVAGQQLDFLTTAGKFSPAKDLGDGQYQADLQIDASASDQVKVHVSAATGTMASLMVPVSDDAAADADNAWGDLTGNEDTFGGDVTPEPTKVPKPKPETDFPWFRLRLSGIGSTYAYEQRPSQTPGPLLPEVLAVGKSAGGRNATPLGGEIEIRGWLPPVTYLGFDVKARTSRYAISAEEFQGSAGDWLYDVSADLEGRYPFEFGNTQVWIGAEIGFRYTDFMVFRGCLEPDCSVEYGPLGLPGLGLGGNIGAEINKFYIIGGTSQALAFGTVRYGTTVDFNLGYQILPNFFADAGFTGVWRHLTVEGKDSGLERGELSDSQIIFKLGVGYSM